MKVLLLADSCALPRSFPKSHACPYEDTYAYRLKKARPHTDIAVVAFGGATSTDLVRNAVAYYDGWQPDQIIVQCGAADCTPLPVSTVTTLALVEYEMLGRLAKFVYRPDIAAKLIRFKTHDRVSLKRFTKNIEKLQFAFPKAQIGWLEIFTSKSGALEESRPGILRRIKQYNAAIHERLGDQGLIKVGDAVNSVAGVHNDHVHLNRYGHEAVFNVLYCFLELAERNTASAISAQQVAISTTR